MHILVIGRFYSESFALHIAETLETMGCGVSRYEVEARLSVPASVLSGYPDKVLRTVYALTDQVPALRARQMHGLWNLIDSCKPLDLVLVCNDFLWPDEVGRVKAIAKCPVAMWFPDSIANIGRGYFFTAPYDALFFKDPFIVERVRQVVRGSVYYLPECMNPARHCFEGELSIEDRGRYGCDITTAGNLHSYRVAFFSHLTDFRVKIWGHAPPKWLKMGAVAPMFQHRPVHNIEKAKAFKSAKVVLNNLHYSEMEGVNVRTFEVAAASAFQLIDWRRGLAQLFEDGVEIVSFSGIDDLKGKIRQYLPDEEFRRAVGAAGKRRAIADHTYEKRLRLLLDTMAGREQGFPTPKNL